MQEVFEKIIEKLEEERDQSYADFESYTFEYSPYLDSEYDDFFHKGLERATRLVKQVAAEYNNGWIPCSVVDHPEHCRECEVTMIDKYDHTRDIAFYTDRWRRASDEAEIIVIAWKEPSEPYHPKEII